MNAAKQVAKSMVEFLIAWNETRQRRTPRPVTPQIEIKPPKLPLESVPKSKPMSNGPSLPPDSAQLIGVGKLAELLECSPRMSAGFRMPGGCRVPGRSGVSWDSRLRKSEGGLRKAAPSSTIDASAPSLLRGSGSRYEAQIVALFASVTRAYDADDRSAGGRQDDSGQASADDSAVAELIKQTGYHRRDSDLAELRDLLR